MSKTANSIGLRIGLNACDTSAPMRILPSMGAAVFLFAWFAGMSPVPGNSEETALSFVTVLLLSIVGMIPGSLNQLRIDFRQPSRP